MTTKFWKVFYNLVIIPCGWIFFQLLRLVDPKVRRGMRGRRDLFERLQQDVARLKPNRKRIWFHSSSMGEFEQAKPIIAELKKRYPEIEIVVSFFSPSGYEHSKAYKFASIITYIPFDSYGNAERFVDLVRPTAAVMVRYDVWPNHVWALQRAGIPTFISNATLRPTSIRLYPGLRQAHRVVYNAFNYILTVSAVDRESFQKFSLDHPILEAIGDTRYDQVWQRSADSRNRHVFPPTIVEGKKVLVVGSSWQEDEEKIFPAFYKLIEEDKKLLMVLVPHEPTIEHIERIEFALNGHAPSIRFSTLTDYSGEKVIIIDSVGILMALYQYAHVAYVGGSFRQGVHNVLEPAVYGLPLVIGPKHENSQEARKLVQEGGAFVGATELEIYGHLNNLLHHEGARTAAGKKSLEFVQRNTGATQRFLSYLEKVL